MLGFLLLCYLPPEKSGLAQGGQDRIDKDKDRRNPDGQRTLEEDLEILGVEVVQPFGQFLFACGCRRVGEVRAVYRVVAIERGLVTVGIGFRHGLKGARCTWQGARRWLWWCRGVDAVI